MKRIFAFLFSVIFILIAGDAAALNSFSWGIKAGINLSDISSDEIDSKARTGFIGGFFMQLEHYDLTLQPELLFAVKGYKVRLDENAPQTLTEKVNLEYFEIPVLVKYNLPLSDKTLKPSLYFGPVVDICTRAEAESKAGLTTRIGDITERIVYGLAVGADLGIRLAGSDLTLDIRYTRSLTDTYEDTKTLITSSDTINAFSFMLGVAL